jgi:hypothetical protein
MIDRSGRGGMGPTNAGGKPISRAYPAKPKSKSAISSLAGAMADAVMAPAKVIGSVMSQPSPPKQAFKPKRRIGGY